LISAYVMAGFLPQFGLWLRHIEFGQIRLTDGSSVKITLSLLMLSFLLFGTGIAKLSPGATRSRKALPGKCFRIWKFLRCFANTVELSQT
ncbi:hypothetical protein ACP3W1_24400, partial [Salmonella enterica]|uniref:hypothetical protein n=1 Tax=Salmonella enterica TaxID=28901 RepID=UPI003CF02417